MLSAIWAGIKAIATMIGWAKQASDQKTGRDLQAGEDAIANVKVKDAQLKAAADSPGDLDAFRKRLRDHDSDL